MAPALLFNNLVVHRSGDYVSYAAPTAIVSVQTATGTPCFRPLQLPPGTYVEFLTGVTDPATEHITLVAALTNRTAIVVVNGVQTHVVSAAGSAESFTCAAVTRVGHTEEMLVVLGESEGCIETLRCTLQGQPVKTAASSMPVQAHEHRSITALDVEVPGDDVGSASMASGDVAGQLVLWQAGNPVLALPATDTSDAITAVKLMGGTGRVAVAYGCGQIKILLRESGAAAVVIQAHSRWINAMTYHAAEQLLMSAAEDAQLFLWNTSTADAKLVCVARGNVPNELPTGVAMIGTHRVVVQLSYDVARLRLLSMVT